MTLMKETKEQKEKLICEAIKQLETGHYASRHRRKALAALIDEAWERGRLAGIAQILDMRAADQSP